MPHQNKIVLKAPAKVNLFLLITGRREDGYHLIYTLFQKIALYDSVELAAGEQNGIVINCPDWLDSGPGNLAYRAAEAFYNAAGLEPGVTISIDKKIPAGGGLGGGSSNAAAVLSGLNALYDSPLSRETLHRLAASIGADCPFFLLDAPAAIGTGTGSDVQKIDTPRRWLVLVLPGFGVSTQWAYQNFELTTSHQDTIFDARAHLDTLMWRNDLEQPVLRKYPQIGEIKQQLLSLGAQAAMMSGSGSTVFGVFPSRKAAEKAVSRIAGLEKDGLEAYVVQTL